MGSLGTHEKGNWSHKCGATLIGEIIAITAGHCVNTKIDVITK
jgi:V8-like Glu-specific endopeptidase